MPEKRFALPLESAHAQHKTTQGDVGNVARHKQPRERSETSRASLSRTCGRPSSGAAPSSRTCARQPSSTFVVRGGVQRLLRYQHPPGSDQAREGGVKAITIGENSAVQFFGCNIFVEGDITNAHCRKIVEILRKFAGLDQLGPSNSLFCNWY